MLTSQICGFRFPFVRLLILVVFYLSCDKFGNTDGERNKEDSIPIDLVDIGYFQGGWEKFCDPTEIHEEFSYYPDHEVKKIRIIVCTMIWEQGRYGNESIATCALYKYCMMMKSRVDQFLDRFLDAFSMGDEDKRLNLTHRVEFNNTTPCYETSVAEFDKKCIAPENAFNAMFKQIFSRACTDEELSTEKILSTIEEVCQGKYMTDQIDWIPYIMSIPVKKAKRYI